MSVRNNWVVLWSVLSSFFLVSLLLLFVSDSITVQVTGATTMAVLTTISYILILRRSVPHVFWNLEQGILLVYRSWSVEAHSARMLTSVPLGIDVSYSAKKVMQAMSERFKKSNDCELGFVVYRPLENSPTRVGFMTTRQKLIPFATRKKVQELCDNVFQDAAILESSMRASYPHTPVESGCLDDFRTIMSGGTAVVA